MAGVVAILGSGRCGSTALGALLGAAPNAVFVGELRHVHRDRARPCRCGDVACPVWSGVSELLPRIRDRGGHRHLPEALWGEEADDAEAELIDGLAAAAGVPWVVDTSKTPAWALRMARRRPVLALTLHRSSRGLASAHGARRGLRPQPGRSAIGLAVHDLTTGAALSAAGRVLGSMSLMWEDVARDPGGVVNHLVERGGPDARGPLAHLLAGGTLPIGHPKTANRMADAGMFRWAPPVDVVPASYRMAVWAMDALRRWR